MAKSSNISWTRSTFNPWIGCTKVSPGCDHCYAEVSTPSRSMGVQWGAGQPRHRTSVANWNQVLRWNEQARKEREASVLWNGRPGFWPVFCASLADVFDNEVPQEWRADLFDLIYKTPNLTWLLLTKRIGNVEKMMPWDHDLAGGPPQNVWIGASIVNQQEADRDIPKLLATPAAKRFVSYEPALGPISWLEFFYKNLRATSETRTHQGRRQMKLLHDGPSKALDWIIVGGESDQAGHKARPFDIGWARSTVEQCKSAGVPVFVKQFGSNVASGDPTTSGRYRFKDRAGADPSEWPLDLRVQEFPNG